MHTFLVFFVFFAALHVGVCLPALAKPHDGAWGAAFLCALKWLVMGLWAAYLLVVG